MSVVHGQADRSWWSGRRTALCGAVFEAKEVESAWFSSITCPACKRLMKQRKK